MGFLSCWDDVSADAATQFAKSLFCELLNENFLFPIKKSILEGRYLCYLYTSPLPPLRKEKRASCTNMLLLAQYQYSQTLTNPRVNSVREVIALSQQ